MVSSPTYPKPPSTELPIVPKKSTSSGYLLRGHNQAQASGTERLGFTFVNLKNLLQTGELHHFANGFAQAVEDEAGALVAGSLESFDKRGDTGTVNVANLLQIEEHLRGFLLLNFLKQGLAHGGRVSQIDVPRD